MKLNKKVQAIGKTGLMSLLFMTIFSAPLHLLSRSSHATNEFKFKDLNSVQIDNFKNFQFRLQDAFNNQSLVSIFYQDDRIILVEIIRQVLDFDLATATVGRPSNGGSGGTGGGG